MEKLILESQAKLFAEFFDLSIDESQDFINYLKTKKNDTKRKS